MLDIRKNHEHETPVPNTPHGYQLLYQRAWSFNPNERPLIDDKSDLSSANSSDTIHFDNTNILHHRTGSELDNPQLTNISRHLYLPLPNKPPQIVTDQKILPPVLPKKPHDIYLNHNSSASQPYERYKLEEQQNVTFSIDPIQNNTKSAPFKLNNFHIEPQYDSAPTLHGYSQQRPPPPYDYYRQPLPPPLDYSQQGLSPQPLLYDYYQQPPPNQHDYYQQDVTPSILINQSTTLQQSNPSEEPSPQNYNLNINQQNLNALNQQNSSPLNQSPSHSSPLHLYPLTLRQPPVLPPKIPISKQPPNSSIFIHKNIAQTDAIPHSYHGEFEHSDSQNINQSKAQTEFIPHVNSQARSQVHSYGLSDQPTGQNMNQDQPQIINPIIKKSLDAMYQELLTKHINEYKGVRNFQEPTCINYSSVPLEIPSLYDNLSMSKKETTDEYIMTTRSTSRYEGSLTDFEELALSSTDVFDRISYSTHVVTINNESKTCNNVDGMKLGNKSEGRYDISQYISVYSTISQGPSDIAITEAERLFSLLKSQKDKIDNILDSHTVYAVGPKFQSDYSMPYIACWVANPLMESVMKKISGLFNHEFEVAYHLVKANGNDEDPNNASNASDGGVEFEDKKLIGENKKMVQFFNITIKLWVNVKLNSRNNASSTLEFEIDLNNCTATDLLSEQCPSLEICVSPLKSDDTCIIIQSKKHSLHNANNDVTSIKVHENDYHFQIDAGAPQSTKATFVIGKKKGQSSIATTKEWVMRAQFSGTIDNRIRINTDVHKSQWYIENEIEGFRVTITQNPQLVQQLVISFANLKELNSDFKKLAKKKGHGGFVTVTSKHNGQPQQENDVISRNLFGKNRDVK
ncbi:5825_t:CDS:2, partial [Cetraspora pellucida]